jgi:hypothetical protein
MFNGLYTVQNTRTQEHRTFAIRTQKEDSRFAPGRRVLSLLTGPDNEKSYRGFAFLDDRKDVPQFYLWMRFKSRPAFIHYANMMKVAVYAVSNPSPGERPLFQYGNSVYSVALSKRCLRCNRTLTTPDSLTRGVGPECAAVLGFI